MNRQDFLDVWAETITGIWHWYDQPKAEMAWDEFENKLRKIPAKAALKICQAYAFAAEPKQRPSLKKIAYHIVLSYAARPRTTKEREAELDAILQNSRTSSGRKICAMEGFIEDCRKANLPIAPARRDDIEKAMAEARSEILQKVGVKP